MDLLTGKLTGSAYCTNCGWISLSNSMAVVQTDAIQPAPLARNGLPVPWLLANFGTLTVAAHADPDGDGQSNAQEYLADTNPNNQSDVLAITSYKRNVLAPAYNQFTWNSHPTRFYTVQYRATLDANSTWADFGYFTVPGVSATGFFDTNPQRFYRIRAYRPLMP